MRAFLPPILATLAMVQRVMNQDLYGISQKSFAVSLLVVILVSVAFPLYQLFTCDGYLFYLNGLDEASHLSWWYASYVVDESGRLRESSRLVKGLHLLGLSGGYINFLFDIVAPACMILCLKRIFIRLGYQPSHARAASIIAFAAPVVFSLANPCMEWLTTIHFRPGIVEWLAMPYSSNTPLLRTPEPQLSWLLICVVLAFVRKASWIPWILLCISPLLYPFVRLPILFTAIATILASRKSLWSSLIVSYLCITGCTFVYIAFMAESSLRKFFIFSHLPVISFTGGVSTAIYLATRRGMPVILRPLLLTGIVSIWLVQNTQIVSGWFVTPVNFEQYWGLTVIAFVAATAILGKPKLLRCWAFVALLCFFSAGMRDFSMNLSIASRITTPEVVLPALAKSAEDMVFDDLYMATVLDMVHPRQAPTAFSWTRTLHADSNEQYSVFQCTKKLLLQQHDSVVTDRFLPIMEHLKRGFSEKGADLNVTMGRMPIPRMELPANEIGAECTQRRPPIVPTSSSAQYR